MSNELVEKKIIEGVNALVEECHGRSVKAGWWKNLETGEDLPLTKELILSKIALIHSEISEALEGIRKDLMDDHLSDRPMAEVEFGDAMIRLADLAGKLKYDLGGTIVAKLNYNSQRPDHKLENRMKPGGKKA